VGGGRQRGEAEKKISNLLSIELDTQFPPFRSLSDILKGHSSSDSHYCAWTPGTHPVFLGVGNQGLRGEA
jgi:hypothetical protein